MNILFLGGDKRYKLMMEDLVQNENIYQIGFKDVITKESNIEDINLSDFDVVLFPITGLSNNLEIKTEQGLIKLPEKIFDNINDDTLFFTGLKTNKLLKLIPASQLISFLDDKEVEDVNNNLTVDGTLDDISHVKNNSVCILGYGTLGKELYLKLKESGNNTYVISRPKELIIKDNVTEFYPLNDENICKVFKLVDVVINTIPYNIIPEEALKCQYVPYILDIASAPYGVNQEIIKKYKHVKYHLYPGIPSKFAPEEASKILLKSLKEKIM